MVTDSRKTPLPEGWRWVKLGDACRVVNGTTPKSGVQEYWGEDIIWVTPTDLGKLNLSYIKGSERRITNEGFESCNLEIVPPRSVVLSSRAPIGHLGIASVPLCTNQGCKSFVLGEGIDSDFLFFALKDSVSEIQQLGSGATFAEVSKTQLEKFEISLPPLTEQKRIAAILRERMDAVERARKSAEEQLEAAKSSPAAFVEESLRDGDRFRLNLSKCLDEIKEGIGKKWNEFRVVGATKNGLAPAKESVGKYPARYKPVMPTSVFYNPMRILIGSIAMVDEQDEAGITSPDYVVLKGREGVLDTRWFYYWFRSVRGANLVMSLSRGAVRERILFRRLSTGTIEIPSYEHQMAVSVKMKEIPKIIKKIESQLETINALPAVLLRQAFRGEL